MKPRRKCVGRTGSSRGKTREQIEARRTLFAAFFHNSSSLLAAGSSFFYSTLDLRSMLIHSNSKRLLARTGDAPRRGAARLGSASCRAPRLACARYTFEIRYRYPPVSNPDAYIRTCVYAYRAHMCIHTYVYIDRTRIRQLVNG